MTGRPRRCGWFDAAALKRSIQINGVSGLCVTKLDVLDGVETLQIGIGYDVDGERLRHPAVGRGRAGEMRAGLRGDSRLVRQHSRA